jgi:hypothetical protein
MTASTAAPPVGNARRRPEARLVARSGPSEPRRSLELDTVTRGWQRAFDATDHALAAASGFLPESALRHERSALTHERQQTVTLLGDLARLVGIHPAPWLPHVPASASATAASCIRPAPRTPAVALRTTN